MREAADQAYVPVISRNTTKWISWTSWGNRQMSSLTQNDDPKNTRGKKTGQSTRHAISQVPKDSAAGRHPGWCGSLQLSQS